MTQDNNIVIEENNSNINCPGVGICTGCGVCSAVCPVEAISMILNSDGFLEAFANNEKCTGCSLCKRVCSKYDNLGSTDLKEIFKSSGEIYGASSNNYDIRMKCSSGGLGHEIAVLCMKEGYIVCGAAYDAKKDITSHSMGADEKELEAFKGSKYMQSYTDEAFSAFEKDKKYVVFGAPCQIYSLYKYLTLKGMNENFILVDFFCHGVPSRLLWNKYIQHIKEKYNTGNIVSLNFRDKKTGWHNYSMHIKGENTEYFENMEDDLFYNFFLSDVCLNKPCYDCSFRRGDMRSDIRLGDFWGAKYKENNEGVSIVTGNTLKGVELIKKIQKTVRLESATIDELIMSQPQTNITIPENKGYIMELLRSDSTLNQIYKKTLMKKHIAYKLKSTLKRIVPADLRKALKKLKG